MNSAYSDDTMNRNIEDFCVEMEGKAFFSLGFNQNRAEFWKCMNVKVVRDLLRINDFDIDAFPEFNPLAKRVCKAFISHIQAGAPQRGNNVQQDQTAATARPAPPAGGSSSSASASQSEVERLQAELRRQKRKTEELQADKERLVAGVGAIQKEWQKLNKKLLIYSHPNRNAKAAERDATEVFQDVGVFTDHLQAVLDHVDVID